MAQVEEVMKLSLRQVTQQAIEAYGNVPRTEWVLNWPGQVVLAASITHWTAEVTQVGIVLVCFISQSEYKKRGQSVIVAYQSTGS